MFSNAPLLKDDSMRISLHSLDELAAFLTDSNGFFESPDCRLRAIVDPGRIHN